MTITAYVGPNGSGKTLGAVSDILDDRKAWPDRPIYSTLPISYTTDAGVLIESRPVESWEQLLSLESCDVLLDEVVRIASSRETAGLPPDVVSWLGMLRHYDVTLAWTAPAWARADVLLRESTQRIFEFAPKVRRTQRASGLRWRQTLVSLRREYAGDEEEGGKWPGDDARTGRKLIRLRKQTGYGAYPARYRATQLSEHSRICDTCGKTKRREYCNGKHETDSLDHSSTGSHDAPSTALTEPLAQAQPSRPPQRTGDHSPAPARPAVIATPGSLDGSEEHAP